MRTPGKHRRPGGFTARRRPGLDRGLRTPSASAASAVLLLVAAAVLASPAGTTADSALNALASSRSLTGRPFEGTPTVGALFASGPDGRADHFCTATVVHSPNRNLVMTAAHCLTRFAASPRSVTFVPGYHDRQAPYGTWLAVHIVVDRAWASSADPDDDVAFLVVTGQSARARIEDVTGAERLLTGRPPTMVRVIGYPNGRDRPVICQNRATAISGTQQRFDCGGFTDGTSGGPFLAGVRQSSGEGLVVGVIGGYQQGGTTPEISYSPTFGTNVAALYRSAIAVS